MKTENRKFNRTVDSEEGLRALIGMPSELVDNKVISRLDDSCLDFISKSPFLAMSTSDNLGSCDVSPRGDHAGFVHVIDENTLIIPERPGNKRIDSMRNILTNPYIGLIFIIPGLGETLRVNGKASLVTDDDLMDQMQFRGKKPVLGIGVEIEECYIHCAKAFKRSKLWEPESWLEKGKLPAAARMLFEHAKLPNTTEASIKGGLEESYSKRLY